MRSDLPKVMHRVAGRPLLAHVLAALEPLDLRTVVVTSPAKDEVRNAIAATGLGAVVEYAVQDSPRGTANAVKIALDALGDTTGPLLVVSGESKTAMLPSRSSPSTR
jgi:bifunctional UDP-N-acetylglucosamine pyrophosphorylase/glucosamine-1-phosphate N-acetyltransferase